MCICIFIYARPCAYSYICLICSNRVYLNTCLYLGGDISAHSTVFGVSNWLKYPFSCLATRGLSSSVTRDSHNLSIASSRCRIFLCRRMSELSMSSIDCSRCSCSAFSCGIRPLRYLSVNISDTKKLLVVISVAVE